MAQDSDEEEFPTLDFIFNKNKKVVELKSTKILIQSNSNASQEVSLTPVKKIVASTSKLSSPTSIEKHRALALDLFPPSPPIQILPTTYSSLSTSTNTARSSSPTRSIISDSEPDLPSSPKNKSLSLTEGLEIKSCIARHSSVESLWVNNSDEESFDESAAQRKLSSTRGLERESLPARSVFHLSESETEGIRFGAAVISDVRTPKASTSTRTPRIKSPSSNKRRIAISVVSSSDSDSSYTSDSPPPATPRAMLDSTRKAKAAATFGMAEAMECICLTDSDDDVEEEEEEELVGRLVSPKKNKKSLDISELTPVKKKIVAVDLDSNEGVLTYEPTPRARKPIKLTGSTPIRKISTGKTPTATRNIISIDLTTSSDSSDDDVSFVPISKSPTKPKSKPLFQPSLALPSIQSTPKSKHKPKPVPSVSLRKTLILTASERETLPIALIRELDRAVFRKEWEGMRIVGGEGAGLPDGMEINWNKRLLNTAGRATVKTLTSNGVQTHQTLVDLSVKVTDTETKLKHTLAHELCHVVSWVISKEMKPSHGPAFKLWAARVMKVRPDIKISTTHSYEIAYKYRWQCLDANCLKIFQRHSNSINTESHGCSCGSKLTPIDKEGNVKVPRTPMKKSAWQEFLTAMGPRVRLENPGKNQGEITKIISVMWKEAKDLALALEVETAQKNSLEAEKLVDEMAALKVA